MDFLVTVLAITLAIVGVVTIVRNSLTKLGFIMLLARRAIRRGSFSGYWSGLYESCLELENPTSSLFSLLFAVVLFFLALPAAGLVALKKRKELRSLRALLTSDEWQTALDLARERRRDGIDTWLDEPIEYLRKAGQAGDDPERTIRALLTLADSEVTATDLAELERRYGLR